MGKRKDKKLRTALKPRNASKRAFASGVESFKGKPFTLDELLACTSAKAYQGSAYPRQALARYLAGRKDISSDDFGRYVEKREPPDLSSRAVQKKKDRAPRVRREVETGETTIPQERLPGLRLLVLELLSGSKTMKPSASIIQGLDSKFQVYTLAAFGNLLSGMVSDGCLEVQGKGRGKWYGVTRKGTSHLKARRPKEEKVEKATPSPKSASPGTQPPIEKKSVVSLAGFSGDEKNRREMLELFRSHSDNGWYLRSEYSARLREHFEWEDVAGNAIGRIIFALSGTYELFETRGEKAQQELRLSATGRSVLGMEVADVVAVPAQPVEIPQAEVAETEVPVPVTGVGRTVDITKILSQVALEMGLVPDEGFGVGRPPILLSTASDSGEVARLTTQLTAEQEARKQVEAELAATQVLLSEARTAQAAAEADAEGVRASAAYLLPLVDKLEPMSDALDLFAQRLVEGGLDTSLPEEIEKALASKKSAE